MDDRALYFIGQFVTGAAFTGLLMAYINAKSEALMAQLKRVEEVLDTRLKHLEGAKN